jgi:cytochrome P450
MATTQRPPEPDGLPVLGHALAFSRDPLSFLERAVADCGDVVGLSVPGNSGVILAHPEHAERVLVTDADRFPKGEFQRRELSGLLGNGSLIADGDEWLRRREALQPAFYARRVEAARPEMRAATERVAADWTDGDRVDVHDAATDLTLSVLAHAFFDVDVEPEADRIAAAADAIAARFSQEDGVPFYVPDWVPLPSHRRYSAAVSDLDDVAYDLLDGAAGDVSDVLAAVLDSDLSREELRDELVTLLLAGHETTSTALAATVFLLATNPDEQARLHDALQSTSDPLDCDRLRAVVDEALRRFPPVHLMLREAGGSTEFDGYRIPAGALVGVPTWVLHRDDRWWDAPDEFRPDRFLGDPAHPEFAYLPFGAGQRQCIGRRFALQELQVAVATLLGDYRFEATDETAFEPAVGVNLRPGGPVEVRVRER